MSDVLYPWGYKKRMVDIVELKRLAHFDEMEPEAAQRFEAWLVSRQGSIGIGSSIRDFQPVKPGFAPAGMSFHLPVLFNDGRVEFMALDLVCPNGENVHRSPRWDEVPRQGSGHPDIAKYGVHCNVNGEPWHMQCIEVDGFQSWVNAGRKHPNPNFVLPVEPKPDPIPNPIPDPIPNPQPPTTGVITVQFTSRKLVKGTSGSDVAWLQKQLNTYAGQNIDVDGSFGGQTEAAVINWQRFFGLTVDGEAGAKTQQNIIEVAMKVG